MLLAVRRAAADIGSIRRPPDIYEQRHLQIDAARQASRPRRPGQVSCPRRAAGLVRGARNRTARLQLAMVPHSPASCIISKRLAPCGPAAPGAGSHAAHHRGRLCPRLRLRAGHGHVPALLLVHGQCPGPLLPGDHPQHPPVDPALLRLFRRRPHPRHERLLGLGPGAFAVRGSLRLGDLPGGHRLHRRRAMGSGRKPRRRHLVHLPGSHPAPGRAAHRPPPWRARPCRWSRTPPWSAPSPSTT